VEVPQGFAAGTEMEFPPTAGRREEVTVTELTMIIRGCMGVTKPRIIMGPRMTKLPIKIRNEL
jgi:hypothetical protein